MWPWGHLAVGYLAFTLAVRTRAERRPRGGETLVLAVWTQFPDLVDKPLALTLGVLPSGRSLAHSLLVAVPILVLVTAYARRRGYASLGVAAATGYLTHLAGDSLRPVATGEFESLGSLAWPITALAPSSGPGGHGILDVVLSVSPTPYVAFQVALVGIAAAAWVADGSPGVRDVRRLVAEGSLRET